MQGKAHLSVVGEVLLVRVEFKSAKSKAWEEVARELECPGCMVSGTPYGTYMLCTSIFVIFLPNCCLH